MQRDILTITILGSGTSTGIPVIGCHCAVCRSHHPMNQRTRCSALLSYNDHNILIDTSTDLRQQLLREQIQHIDAVLYTHSHADHVHGIDDLRGFNFHTKNRIPLYGRPQTLSQIAHRFNYIFSQALPSGYIPHLELCPLEQPLNLCGLKIEPIPLQHGRSTTCGYRCGPLAYLTDCNTIPISSMAKLHGLDLLILDGLRFAPHPTHFNIPQAIEVAMQIGARQTLLTHISHEVDHPVHNHQLPAGISLAYDGLKISLPMPPEDRS